MSTTPKTDIIEAAHGRWREIILALTPVERRFLNGKQQACPVCGGGKDRFQFTDRSGEGDFICRVCGAGKGMQLLMKLTGMTFPEAARKVEGVIGLLKPTLSHVKHQAVATPYDLNGVWREGSLVAGNIIAERYFRRRGLNLALSGYKSTLRLASSLYHRPTGTWHPCLLARFSDAQGMPKQIHRTYLAEAGTKADVEPCRMFMPGPLPAGGAIRLGDEAEVMGVAEGIETALSASVLFGMPVWATTSDGMLAKWLPPAIAKHVTIFADNDAGFAGQAAAYALARRLVYEAVKQKIERVIEVRVPEAIGQDWNDVLFARGETYGAFEGGAVLALHGAARPTGSASLQDVPRGLSEGLEEASDTAYCGA